MSAETELLERARAEILAVRKAFGAPGDYGYGTPQGKALKALYDLHNEIATALKPSAPPLLS
jgi:hypothetical protein